MPVGSILDSILRAQQLDTIDSFIAVELMDKLFLKYKALKHHLSLQGNCLYPIDPQRPECRESLEKFILQNAQDLDTVVSYHISVHFPLILTCRCFHLLALALPNIIDSQGLLHYDCHTTRR